LRKHFLMTSSEKPGPEPDGRGLRACCGVPTAEEGDAVGGRCG